MLSTPTPTELGNSMPLLLAPLEPLRPSPVGKRYMDTDRLIERYIVLIYRYI